MRLHDHITQVATQLDAAAALGDERTREIAHTLAVAATPAVRLALLAALSEACDEITAVLLDLPGSPTVAMRLDGDEAVVDVRLADTPTEAEPPVSRDEGEATARISLRLTEALKSAIDTAAEQAGVSVNTWLVRAATNALNPNPFDALAAFGRASGGFGGGPQRPGGGAQRHGGGGHQRITGWING
jgi:hypothetical protein